MAAKPITWIPVRGGRCLYGDAAKPRHVADLLVAAIPLTCGPDGLPITLISWDDAQTLAAAVGGRLPSSVEWEWLAAGPDRRRYPWGDLQWAPDLARLWEADLHHDGPAPAGSYPAGATPDGLLDLTGNVWEWTASKVLGDAAIIRGGSYASKPLYGQSTFLNAAGCEHVSRGIGVRPVKTA